jgi:L-alanine-DL-glutamate epimerase-like enolase superfamily enzyme
MQLFLHDVELPLLHPFTIARGSKTVQQALLVELISGTYHGFGEASVSKYYGMSISGMRAALEAVRPDVERYELAHPDLNDVGQLWERLDGRLGDCRFAQCALDEAAHDLWGKCLGQPLWKLWQLDPDRGPGSDYTIGIDTIERMIAKLREFPDWPAYKIKLGTAEDVAIVRALRGQTAAPLRVDANCGWTVEQALANAVELKKLGVELIEQPLPADDWTGARRLFEASPLPIFADESCVVLSDVERCVGHFHGINIKLQKCGGLTPARRMIQRARQLGLQVMVGCMNESTVGISAAAQLLPLLDFADLDGAALLARDIATGVRIERGRAVFPAEGGCGTRLLV